MAFYSQYFSSKPFCISMNKKKNILYNMHIQLGIFWDLK